MKKLILLVALVALVAAPALARENVRYNGEYPTVGTRVSDVELEYDGLMWYSYGLSPYWTDFTVVNYQMPVGGPWLVNEVRYYCKGTQLMSVVFMNGGGLSSPPTTELYDGPDFTPISGSWPPPDFTTVDVSGMGFIVNDGDIVRPGVDQLYTDFGIGLAYAFADGNPGHSWDLYAGAWTDDTYGYDTDDGIRLGINYYDTIPVDETTWGAVKNLFK